SSERRSSESAAIASTSSALGARNSSGDELIKRVRETDEVGLRARRRQLERLAQAVDPDRQDAELGRRHDVVEVRCGDVDIGEPLDALLERAPVSEARL